MDDEYDDAITAMGAQIGRRMAAAKGSTSQPAIAARLFANALIAQYPAVKFPELLRDSEVQRWLSARSLAEGQLRQALTEARRAARTQAVDQPIKRRRGRNASVADSAPPPLPSVADSVAGSVPNRPLSDL